MQFPDHLQISVEGSDSALQMTASVGAYFLGGWGSRNTVLRFLFITVYSFQSDVKTRQSKARPQCIAKYAHTMTTVTGVLLFGTDVYFSCYNSSN
jgi:hypothetical protein